MAKHRLSNRLSPQAKKRLLTAGDDDSGVAVVEVAPAADADALRLEVEHLGGTVRSFVPETRLMNVEIPAQRLGELAESAGVVYVGVDDGYSL